MNWSNIEKAIEQALRSKLKKYKPESKVMPFHHRLLGKDRMALYSFIQSLNTTFGTSIFEPVAVELAKNRFPIAKRHYHVGDIMSISSQKVVTEIINGLSIGGVADKCKEIEQIRNACSSDDLTRVKPVKADLYLETDSGEIYLFDIKTVKPNKSNFKDFKRTLLEWCAITLTNDPNCRINSLIAIPYNSYEPQPYERWTMKGMLDLNHELKVAEEFWDFLGGDGSYQNLLKSFENVGIRLKSFIDKHFEKFII